MPPQTIQRLRGEPWHEYAVLHHGAGVNAVRFSPDGKQLASGGDDRRVRIWDVAAGSRLAELPPAERRATLEAIR